MNKQTEEDMRETIERILSRMLKDSILELYATNQAAIPIQLFSQMNCDFPEDDTLESHIECSENSSLFLAHTSSLVDAFTDSELKSRTKFSSRRSHQMKEKIRFYFKLNTVKVNSRKGSYGSKME